MENQTPNLKKRGNPKSVTSSVVAENVRAYRADLDLKGLSVKLDEIDWPISVAALSRLENGERRIDVDDLMALAVALDVSPARLLLPRAASNAGNPCCGTGLPPDVNRDEAHAWMHNRSGLSLKERFDYWGGQAKIALADRAYLGQRRESEDPESRLHTDREYLKAEQRAAKAVERMGALEELMTARLERLKNGG